MLRVSVVRAVLRPPASRLTGLSPRARAAFFDYQAKYEDSSTQYHFDFALPTDVVKAIENTARAACDALRTSGLVRVDLMLDTLHQPWVLEINTIPGLTGHSLVPKAASRLGIGLGELCERAILICLRQAESCPQNRDRWSIRPCAGAPEAHAARRRRRSAAHPAERVSFL